LLYICPNKRHNKADMSKKPYFNLLRKTPPDKPQLIRLYFRYYGGQTCISTQTHCEPRHWDDKKQRCKESAGPPQYRHINLMLSRWEAATIELYYEYKAAGRLPDHAVFRKELLKRLGQGPADETERPPSLIEFAQSFIAEREALGRPKGSLTVYRNALRHLEAYGKARRRKLEFPEINEAFANDFAAHLLAQDFADLHAHKVLETVKTIARAAWKRGIVADDPFAKFSSPIRKPPVDKVYLTMGEVQKLYDLDLSGLNRLAKVRDLFLIGCLTGLRFSDFSTIRPGNIRPLDVDGKEVLCLTKTTQKTSEKVVLPLTDPRLVAILEKYGMQAPPKISNQRLNSYLKELCQLAGIDSPVEIFEHRGGKRLSRPSKNGSLSARTPPGEASPPTHIWPAFRSLTLCVVPDTVRLPLSRSTSK
jgi:site-specific recombinase XerD